jgi:hypothetical protein
VAKALTQIAIDNLKPGSARREVPDGKESGLYLVVQPGRSMSWALRYRFGGRPRKLTLGPYPQFPLAKARAEAAKRAKKPKEEEDRDLVEKAVETFIVHYAEQKQKDATAYETKRVLNKEIAARWRGRRLSKITKSDVHDLLDFAHHGLACPDDVCDIIGK